MYNMHPMARRRKEDAEKTRIRILASALDLFSKKGYEHTTFTDVAAKLKLTKGAVYWHFQSKEGLLVEVVRLALERFRNQTELLIPDSELSFPAVAGLLVKTAGMLIEDPKARAFFRLMKCQIRWQDESMKRVRENLSVDFNNGPREIIKRAIESDIAAGRVRSGVNSEEVAAVVIALWDGLVQAHIDSFLKCEMKATLEHAYAAIWNDIRIVR